MNPKVLVGSPVSLHHQYCTPQYLDGIKSIGYDNYDILLVDNSGTHGYAEYVKSQGLECVRAGQGHASIPERILEGALHLRKHALANGYDYLLIVEQDIIPPRNAISLFLESGKPALTGVYFSFKQVGGTIYRVPVLYTWVPEEDQKEMLADLGRLERENPQFLKLLKEKNFDFSTIRKQVSMTDLEKARLLKVKTSGAGCLFIHRSVLEKVPFRSNPDGFYDVMFGLDLERNGIEFFADTSVSCKHMVQGRPWSWDSRQNIWPAGR